MTKDNVNYVRFDKSTINNYGCFQGENEYTFNSRRTVISGDYGSGKTLFMNVLVNLGFVPGFTPDNKDTDVKVSTHGDRASINKYAHVIFLECECMTHNLEKVYQYTMERFAEQNVIDVVLEIYNRLVTNQPHKRKSYSELTPVGMVNNTEQICLSFALFFATRKLLNINLPLVLDNPFGQLDSEINESIDEYLSSLDCQQILLVNNNESYDYKLI